MRIGPDGIALIKSFEQCARAHKTQSGLFVAYLPTPNDVPTVGWGSTGKDITMATVFTQQQCDDRLAADLAAFSDAVAGLVGTTRTTQHQFDAMVSLAYNIGIAMKGFAGSSVLRRHREGDIAGAAAAFHMWNKQAGKVLAGLVRRRNDEARMYLA